MRTARAALVVVALMIGGAGCGADAGDAVESKAEALSIASGPLYANAVTYSSVATGTLAAGTLQLPTAQIGCANSWASGAEGAAATLAVTPTADPEVVYFERTPAPAADTSGRAYYGMWCAGWARRVVAAPSGPPSILMPYPLLTATQNAAGLYAGDGADTWVAQARSPDGTSVSYCQDQWAVYLLGTSGVVSSYQWWDSTIAGRPFLFGSVLPSTNQVVEWGVGHENQNAGAVMCTATWSGSLALPAVFRRGVSP